MQNEIDDNMKYGKQGRTRKTHGTSTTIPFFIEELALITEATGRLTFNAWAREILISTAENLVGKERASEILNTPVDKEYKK